MNSWARHWRGWQDVKHYIMRRMPLRCAFFLARSGVRLPLPLRVALCPRHATCAAAHWPFSFAIGLHLVVVQRPGTRFDSLSVTKKDRFSLSEMDEVWSESPMSAREKFRAWVVQAM